MDKFDGLLYINAKNPVFFIHNVIVTFWLWATKDKGDNRQAWYYLSGSEKYPFFLKWNPDYKLHMAKEKIDKIFYAMKKELP